MLLKALYDFQKIIFKDIQKERQTMKTTRDSDLIFNTNSKQIF